MNSLLENANTDIYVTGSNSKLMSGEISTYLNGHGSVRALMNENGKVTDKYILITFGFYYYGCKRWWWSYRLEIVANKTNA